MNQESFSPLIHLTLLALFLLPKTSLCVHPRFQACSVPKSCGDGQNIRYPFRIDDQESYCGYPGFMLSCNNNSHPIININGNTYVVQEIFYDNQSFRIANARLLDISDTCFPSIQNLTLWDNRFRFGPNYANLSFYSNCPSSLPKNLTSYKLMNCSDDNGIGSVLAIFGQDPELSYASMKCGPSVVAPVEVYGDEGNGIGGDWEYYEKVLRRGFVLNWIAGNCSLCESSGGRCGFDMEMYQFQCFCPDRPHASHCRARKNKLPLILGTVIPGAVAIPIICLLIFLCRKKWKFASSNLLSRNISAHPSSKSDLERGCVYFGVLPIFSYKELEEATNNFDPTKELGDGGFGTVYHGNLRDGREVAVKRLYENNCKRVEQFMNEIEILTRLRHKNLVSLYGCTSHHSRELLLVYEFIPNGTVADHLHGDQSKPSSLTWPIRMSIAIETADALVYLHASDIIHRDVKTNNILLDNNYSVKVADFGLSRLFPTDVTHVSTAPQGTPGYVDPEYHHCYQLTDKSDVYSFGVVLVELISSLPAVDISRHRHEINLADLAINKIQNSEFSELVDPCLGFESNLMVRRMITSVAELAFQCLQHDKEMRPSMDQVVEALKRIESEKYEMEKIEEVDNDVGVLKNIRPQPSPDQSDDVGLLKNMQLPPSPISVTEKWVSRSTTPSASVSAFPIYSA